MYDFSDKLRNFAKTNMPPERRIPRKELTQMAAKAGMEVIKNTHLFGGNKRVKAGDGHAIAILEKGEALLLKTNGKLYSYIKLASDGADLKWSTTIEGTKLIYTAELEYTSGGSLGHSSYPHREVLQNDFPPVAIDLPEEIIEMPKSVPWMMGYACGCGCFHTRYYFKSEAKEALKHVLESFQKLGITIE